ncbi:hypothetical protein D3C72_808410 [compost metagenome]
MAGVIHPGDAGGGLQLGELCRRRPQLGQLAAGRGHPHPKDRIVRDHPAIDFEQIAGGDSPRPWPHHAGGGLAQAVDGRHLEPHRLHPGGRAHAHELAALAQAHRQAALQLDVAHVGLAQRRERDPPRALAGPIAEERPAAPVVVAGENRLLGAPLGLEPGFDLQEQPVHRQVGRGRAQGLQERNGESAMRDVVLVHGLAGRLVGQGRREHQRAALLGAGLVEARGVGHVARIRRQVALLVAARDRARVAAVEDGGEHGALVQHTIEPQPQRLVADVRGTRRRVGRHDGLVFLVGFRRGRIRHLRAVAGVIEEGGVTRLEAAGEGVELAEDAVVGGLAVLDEDDVLGLEAVFRDEQLAHGRRVVDAAVEVHPGAAALGLPCAPRGGGRGGLVGVDADDQGALGGGLGGGGDRDGQAGGGQGQQEANHGRTPRRGNDATRGGRAGFRVMAAYPPPRAA